MSEIAVCGLMCDSCEMKEATTNKEVAQMMADWFKENRNEIIPLEDFRCDGCHGSRELHWSPDCWILLCCVDEKGNDNCSQCVTFPCEKLEEWAAQNDRYTEALERLKGLT